MKFDAYDIWMIETNLKKIKKGEKNVVKILKANRFHAVAEEVERRSKE